MREANASPDDIGSAMCRTKYQPNMPNPRHRLQLALRRHNLSAFHYSMVVERDFVGPSHSNEPGSLRNLLFSSSMAA